MPTIISTVDGSTESVLSVQVKGQSVSTKKTFSREYYVLADNVDQTEEDITATPNLPRLFETYNNTIVQKITAREETTCYHPANPGTKTILWIVTIDYDSDIDVEQGGGGGGGSGSDPSKYPQTYSWGGEIETEDYSIDAKGAVLQTFAGEPLVSQRPVHYPILKVQRYEHAPFDPATILTYVNKVNSQPFYGAPIGTVMMLPIETEEQTIGGIKFVYVTYTLKFKLEIYNGQLQDHTWEDRILHQGHQYIPPFDPTDPRPAPMTFVDADGNPGTVNLIGGLNKDGQLGYRFWAGTRVDTARGNEGVILDLNEDLKELYPDADHDNAIEIGPYFLHFEPFGEVDFNVLNLGP